ncbi:ATP-binding protein [Micromonospora sp. NPDC049275]|uniref:ATP-binding protein n=1 Tax=Micromonospora sp. NPDC049275 TaxID=3364268 RepID=UPI0037110512
MAKFLTSARAVDMLGRQQIASIPTALSELFKNAYDAYADHVRADYLSSRRILLLRDDGVGMSENDFLSRWLTIATDSKARQSSTSRPPVPRNAKQRPTMGEKGIGRLAVASIGPQLILVSRPRVDTDSATPGLSAPEPPSIAALIQWSMFEIPGLTLDDIEVPLIRISSGEQLTREHLGSLRQGALGSLDKLKHIPDTLRHRVTQELSHLTFDPAPLLRLPGPTLRDEGHGTHFIIAPVSEDLPAAMSTSRRDRKEGIASPFTRLLIGFSNTMLPGHAKPPLKTEFFQHDVGEGPRDLIDEDEFWRPEDFENVDHDIRGSFDEYGQFSGSVSIYGRPPVEHVVPWLSAKGARTKCGPFGLRIGYVQGTPKESRLDAETFALVTRKLVQIGGLYVYRDGIRVLPYGSSDVDYLNIEERRTRNAGRYYFSYRRMFGAVEVSAIDNPDLQEKAGREGFRENGAYRDFKALLENFLVQLAVDFFNKDGTYGGEFDEIRSELRRTESVRRQREKRSRVVRDNFAADLRRALDALESNQVRSDIGEVLESWRMAVARFTQYPGQIMADDVLEAERGARQDLEFIKRRYKVVRPRGIGLTLQLTREFDAYQRSWQRVYETDYLPAAGVIAEDVERIAKLTGSLVIHSRLKESLEEAQSQGRREMDAEVRSTRAMATAAQERVNDYIRECLLLVEAESRQAAVELARLDTSGYDEFEAAQERERLTDRVRSIVELQRTRLSDLQDALSRLAASRSALVEDEVEALEEEVLALKDQGESDLELLQLGTAVQVISHEFEASIRSIRKSIRQMRPWARANDHLAAIFQDLVAAFQHLDGYLTLFTPLQRRLYRQRVRITGEDVGRFVYDVFRERLANHELVRLDVTPAFRSFSLKGYPSTYYPVFVNLVDNALYWVGERLSAGGWVRLDSDGSSMLVVDNGPGIPERDRQAVFESGFTRKPGGRGLGLRIARSLLSREGWVLELPNPQPEVGTCFRISPKNESEIGFDDRGDGK